jgi:hypothetical protein
MEGYRSGLEESVAADLEDRFIGYKFEPYKIPYTQPVKNRKYLPDFEVWTYGGKKLIIETKGRFVTSDRQKHLMIKKDHPDLDIRFIFSNPNQRISKTSKTTYWMWCEKHDFKWAKKTLPEAWLKDD